MILILGWLNSFCLVQFSKVNIAPSERPDTGRSYEALNFELDRFYKQVTPNGVGKTATEGRTI